tara:strand:- start:91 stop:408 length:318 start_codon:yes stop_codon:yes gene_type:complete
MKYLDFSLIIFAFYFCSETCCIQPLLRNKILSRQDNTCGLCKKKFTNMIPHEIHHLNAIHNDNSLSNLVALCCNCHAAHHRFNVSVYPYYNISNNISNIKPYLTI